MRNGKKKRSQRRNKKYKLGKKAFHKVKTTALVVNLFGKSIVKELSNELATVHVLDIAYVVLQKPNRKKVRR